MGHLFFFVVIFLIPFILLFEILLSLLVSPEPGPQSPAVSGPSLGKVQTSLQTNTTRAAQ